MGVRTKLANPRNKVLLLIVVCVDTIHSLDLRDKRPINENNGYKMNKMLLYLYLKQFGLLKGVEPNNQESDILYLWINLVCDEITHMAKRFILIGWKSFILNKFIFNYY